MMPMDAPGGLIKQRSGVGIFLQAMEEGKVQLAHFILAALGEAAVNATIEERQGLVTGRTPLMCAAKLPRTVDRTHFLMLLLARGAEVDRRDSEGRTALSLASECGHLDAVRLLVQHGAHPGSSDSQGRTPLAYAARCRHSAMVKFLVKDLKSRGEEGMGEEAVGEETWLLREEEEHDGHSLEDLHGGVEGVKKSQENPSEDGPSAVGAQGGQRKFMETSDVEGSGSGSFQSRLSAPPKDMGYFLCENTVGDLLLVDHVICNPYFLDEEPGGGCVSGMSRGHCSTCSAMSPLLLQPLTDQVIQNPLLRQSGAREEYVCHSQPYQSPQGSGEMPRSRFISSWLKRGHSYSIDQPPTEVNSTKPPGSFWKWMTPRRVLLSTAEPGPLIRLTDTSPEPHSENYNPLQDESSSTTSALESHYTSAATVIQNWSFLEEGYVGSRMTDGSLQTGYGRLHRVKRCSLPNEMCGMSRDRDSRPPQQVKLRPYCHSGTRSGSRCNVFRALRRHTSPELNFQREGSDTDLEELVPEDYTETERVSD